MTMPFVFGCGQIMARSARSTFVCIVLVSAVSQSLCVPTFATDLDSLIQSSCIDCHDANTETPLDFTTLGKDFEKADSFRQWVRGVTINQCLMRLRKRQRLREESIEYMLPMFDNRGSRVDAASPQQKAEFGEMIDAEKIRELVRKNIDRLPEDYRLVLLLREIDGYSTSEAADILGIKVNAVKTRLHRARSALKYMLEPVLEQID